MTSRDSPSLRQQPFPAAGGMPSHQLPFSEVSCGPTVRPFSSPGVPAEGAAEEGASQELSTCLPTLWLPRAVSPF